jgi:hypothetical protein
VSRRTAAACPAACRRSRAHASQGWSPYCGVNVVSLLRGEEMEPPCYKGRSSCPSRTPQHMPTVLPVRPTEEPFPLARFAVVQHLLTAPHGPYNLPVLPVPLPRLRVHRSRARRGRAPCASPAGQLPALLRPSSATNRLLVSPLSFPTPSPAKPATGAAQFWPEPPPPWPRTTLCLPLFLQGLFREPGTYL